MTGSPDDRAAPRQRPRRGRRARRRAGLRPVRRARAFGQELLPAAARCAWATGQCARFAPEQHSGLARSDPRAWIPIARGREDARFAAASLGDRPRAARVRSSDGHDRDEPEPRRADRRGREGARPLLVVGAERDQPDRRRGRRGPHFWDYDGKRYLDFASQLVNVNIGHQHPKIIQAIKEQADKLCTIGPPMANESRSRLGRLLAEVTPGDLSVSFFTNGGAEANENAIKLARLVDRPPQDHRALSLVPRRDPRRRLADGRPAPLGRRAGRCPASCACSTRTPTAALRAIPIRARSARARRTSRRSSSTRARTRSRRSSSRR